MKSVLPVPCHSHHDYWRRRPLYSALGSGCISIEADVWGVDDNLVVADARNDVVPERTLTSMYLTPILELLEHMNAEREPGRPLREVFYQKPAQTLVSIIDLKKPEIWPLMLKQLQPLREQDYLTFWDGVDRHERPLTIVGSGSTPFNLLTANITYRDVFYDAPLEALDGLLELSWPPSDTSEEKNWSKYNPSNSYYALSNLAHAVGSLQGFVLSESQLDLIRHQVQNARNRGLIPRYWGTIRWPKRSRDEIWGVLTNADVGGLNVEDLRSARKGRWGKCSGTAQRNMRYFYA